VDAKYEFIVYLYEEFWRGEHTLAIMKWILILWKFHYLQSVLHEALTLIVIVIMIHALDVLGNWNYKSNDETFMLFQLT
jgi:hypothetical protein